MNITLQDFLQRLEKVKDKFLWYLAGNCIRGYAKDSCSDSWYCPITAVIYGETNKWVSTIRAAYEGVLKLDLKPKDTSYIVYASDLEEDRYLPEYVKQHVKLRKILIEMLLAKRPLTEIDHENL